MNPRLAQQTIRRGEPLKQMLNTRVPPALRERIADEAAQRGQTLGGYVRSLLARHVADLDRDGGSEG
jgi:predicted HicB family RNase H-like nuclease